MTREFAAFVATAAAAAAINVAAGRLFALFVPLEAAVVLAFPVALTFAYAVNRRLVFRSASGAVAAEYGRFLAVNLAALAVVWAVTIGLARVALPAIGWRWHPELVAHAVGVASPVALSFWLHRTFTFRAGRGAP